LVLRFFVFGSLILVFFRTWHLLQDVIDQARYFFDSSAPGRNRGRVSLAIPSSGWPVCLPEFR